MKLSSFLTHFFILAGAIQLGYAYQQAGFIIPAILLVVLALLTILFLHKGWRWAMSGLLVLANLFAALGFMLDLSPILLISGALSTLLAWDLEHFTRRLKSAGQVLGEARLVRAHLIRLFSAGLLGLALFGITFLIRFQFTFALAILLALLAVFGLSQLIAYLLRQPGS